MSLHKPSTLKHAFSYPKWMTSMQWKFYALVRNNTWILVPQPVNKNVVGNKWVFRIKKLPTERIDKNKSKVVVKVFTRKHGLDFLDAFNLVVKQITIRIVIILALFCRWKMYQLELFLIYIGIHLVEG